MDQHTFTSLNNCRANLTDLFGSSRGGLGGSMISSMTSSTSGLRRNNSMRRMLANQAGLKRRSLALLLKYQTVSSKSSYHDCHTSSSN